MWHEILGDAVVRVVEKDFQMAAPHRQSASQMPALSRQVVPGLSRSVLKGEMSVGDILAPMVRYHTYLEKRL